MHFVVNLFVTFLMNRRGGAQDSEQLRLCNLYASRTVDTLQTAAGDVVIAAELSGLILRCLASTWFNGYTQMNKNIAIFPVLFVLFLFMFVPQAIRSVYFIGGFYFVYFKGVYDIQPVLAEFNTIGKSSLTVALFSVLLLHIILLTMVLIGFAQSRRRQISLGTYNAEAARLERMACYLQLSLTIPAIFYYIVEAIGLWMRSDCRNSYFSAKQSQAKLFSDIQFLKLLGF